MTEDKAAGDSNNELSGTVGGNAWQIRDVHGDLHVGPGAPPPRVPRQLPGIAGHLVGRARELAALTGVRAAGARVAVVSGVQDAPGVGRSALALHWAHQVAAEFPDGCLYADLRGSADAPPVRADHVLHRFLEAFGVERIPPDHDSRLGLYRELVADRRILVVLDDARDADQVRPLLPTGPAAFAVVTARRSLPDLYATHGARPLVLDTLDAPAARELLAPYLGADRLAAEPVDELALLCGRLPAALHILGPYAATMPLATLTAGLEERLGLSRIPDLAGKLAAVQEWRRQVSTSDSQPRISLAAAHNPALLPIAAVAMSATTVAVWTETLGIATLLAVVYLAARFTLLGLGLTWFRRDGDRARLGLGLAAGSALGSVADALTSIHARGDILGWLQFLAVAAFIALLILRLAPLPRPHRPPLLPPSRRPLAYGVIIALAAQFILLFVAIPSGYSTASLITRAGALGALLPYAALGGLCLLVALTTVTGPRLRAFIPAALLAFAVPELFLFLGSLLLGDNFTYVGSSVAVLGGGATLFALFQSAALATLTGCTLLLFRTASPRR
ncbi:MULTISPECIES: hypothetical protein [unclassified Crossiella]|uniref:hypothetical protein n=1 Tax=unclassified Crossiella TaxID=2620835 RepID=UPI001FFF124B|nr:MULTISPECIES: hypothetical protein [unclassified Crossiella]MCK2239476.1 hypothetical protein [Crossiella sp. S99.2]MCK2252171.1 hypothetical protein [Crossiella sp. S99.1]